MSAASMIATDAASVTGFAFTDRLGGLDPERIATGRPPQNGASAACGDRWQTRVRVEQAFDKPVYPRYLESIVDRGVTL